MDEIFKNKKNYLKNLKTSNMRTVRLEIVGDVSENERHFIDGCVLFIAGTMSKNDQNHTKYVSDKMICLIREIVAKVKAERNGGK